MNSETIKKIYLAAALSSGAIIGMIVFYTVLAEILRRMGHNPPLHPPAAYAVKYVFYLLGVSTLVFIKLAERRLDSKKSTPQETVTALTILAVTRAAICEIPAIAGLIMFLLTGYRLDFYLLVVFSVGLEIYHFPRISQWEERLRGDFGEL